MINKHLTYQNDSFNDIDYVCKNLNSLILSKNDNSYNKSEIQKFEIKLDNHTNTCNYLIKGRRISFTTNRNGNGFYKHYDHHQSIYYKPHVDNSIKLAHELYTLNIIEFPSFNRVKNLKHIIGCGKYGQIILVELCKPNNFVYNHIHISDFQMKYAMKCLSNSISYNFELNAYKHMENFFTQLRQHKTLLTNQCVINNHCNKKFKFLSNDQFHPFITKLLSSTVIRSNNYIDSQSNRKKQSFQMMNCLTDRISTGNLNKFKKIYLLLFEHIPGGNLNSLAFINYKRKMKFKQIFFYIIELIEVLTWLHEIGIVHQDLKPDNILINFNGHIKLIDFGLSYVLPNGPGTTYYNNIISSSEHMAPEITLTNHINYKIWHAVDWYSLGILFYRLLYDGNFPPKPTVSDIINYEKWFINLNMLPNFLQILISQFLFPNPNYRLGSNLKLGGNIIFTHPCFIKMLFYSDVNNSFDNFIHLPSDCLGNFLTNDIKQSLFKILNSTNLNHNFNNQFALNYLIKNQILFDIYNLQLNSNENLLPNWVKDLRIFIRNQYLIPPFIPY